RPTLLPFPISIRNSPAVIAHLLRATKVQCVYVSEGHMRTLLEEALQQETPDDQPVTGTKVFSMPTFSDLYPPGVPLSIIADKITPSVFMDSPAIILHSSGSTAYPKPITLTHRTLLEWTRALEYGGIKWKGEIMALHASPVFHAMGVLGLIWSAANLFVRAVRPPLTNAPPPNPEYFLSQIVASGATMLHCVPSFLEAWAEDEAAVKVLQGLKVVVYAGAPLSKKAGTFLHQNGVNIRCHLGGTEYGQVVLYPPSPYSEGYEWFSFSPTIRPHFEPQPGENIFELVLTEAPQHHLSVHNTTVDGVPSYTSNDLVEQHPINKKLWRVVGRKDDQIMLSTGEKTNPGPIEHIINRNDLVKCAVLFGRGRFQNGVIIEPESWDEFTTEEAFRTAVWPNVEEANMFAPSHSRIFKEMILIASPNKPFIYTPKRTPRRGGIVKEYEPEIDALYAAVRESSQIDIQAPFPQTESGGWLTRDAVEFVRKVVLRIMKRATAMHDSEDFFEAGCDSLEATYIRNSILRALRDSAPMSRIHELPTSFVYQHPSIQQLGEYVADISGKKEVKNRGNTEKTREQVMDDMVHMYTRDFPTHVVALPNGGPTTQGEVVLLTGTTGGLGSQMLAQLIGLESVSKIYAFNRPKVGLSSRDRQQQVFLDRGNPPTLLDSEKVIFVEGDTSLEGLGVPENVFDEMRASVTVVIHNAWVVDFKVFLPTLESVIRGVRNLINLALLSPRQQPPRFLFISSIGILRKWLPGRVAEAPVTDPELINQGGYGSSKWISERILLQAASVTPLKPVIIRMGQLTGGLNGCWNIAEWFPSLVRGSQVLGCMPDSDAVVSWLPLHAGAKAVIDLRSATITVAHVVHPRPVSWHAIAQRVAVLLGIPLVPYATWLTALQSYASKNAEDTTVNPALRLLDFYSNSVTPSASSDHSGEAMGFAMMETSETQEQAPSLRQDNLPQLEKENVDIWVRYWRQKGFLE
ncbi:acetyl-CoA synthetase-like protein, partial [Ramaria rubella]